MKNNKSEKEPILMIEGIDVKELGNIFSGYYLNHPKEVTKIINLYRNQGLLKAKDDFINFIENTFEGMDENWIIKKTIINKIKEMK